MAKPGLQPRSLRFHRTLISVIPASVNTFHPFSFQPHRASHTLTLQQVLSPQLLQRGQRVWGRVRAWSEVNTLRVLFAFSILIFMALKNSKTGSLPVSEIYNFMTEHFPYFKVSPRPTPTPPCLGAEQARPHWSQRTPLGGGRRVRMKSRRGFAPHTIPLVSTSEGQSGEQRAPAKHAR